METWGIEQCFLIFLMLLFLCTKRVFQKPCTEATNRSEKQFKEDPNGNGSWRDEPFREECDRRKWRHINGRWILVWPWPPHRPKEMKESRYRHHHRHRHRKPVVQKTGLEEIPEGLENELETESKPEPELVGSYRCGTCWWMQVLCLDDLENEPEHLELGWEMRRNQLAQSTGVWSKHLTRATAPVSTTASAASRSPFLLSPAILFVVSQNRSERLSSLLR